MEQKLDIQKTVSGKTSVLTLKGRLDASWAGYLNDTVNGLVRDGIYHVELDLSEVGYLSSAGIRILIMQYKNLGRIGGSLLLTNLSDQVREVLKMVGMAELLQQTDQKTVVTEPSAPSGTVEEGFRFDRKKLNQEKMVVTVHGQSGSGIQSHYTESDNRVLKAGRNRFALGLGAIGSGFDDCRQRYGEFAAFGDAVAYMPADQSSIPDYSLASGQYVPEINALFAIMAGGEFCERIVFEPAEVNQSITLNKLVEVLFTLTGHQKSALLMVAESDSLIGMRLRKSPVGDPSLLELPGLADNLFFTTEPAYPRMLTISFGYFEKSQPDQPVSWLRPLGPASPFSGHLHTAVFPYQPLKKNNPDCHEIIRALFGSSEVQDILHLLNDTREINGLGDSRFKNGICWIGQAD